MFFDPEDGGDKFQLTSNDIHGVLSQNREIFIRTAVRTSDHAENNSSFPLLMTLLSCFVQSYLHKLNSEIIFHIFR
jgi:hypothetical protein